MSKRRDDFTHDGYRSLVEGFLERGYEARSYSDADPASRHLILRHDVDVSLQAAESLAEIESEIGVSACYFVLLRTEMYNLFSAASRDALRRITAAGHSIGLHLDAAAYSNDAAALDDAANAECRALELATGMPVKFVSFHRPAKALQGLARPLAGRRHAYEPRFFTEMGYCSDSRGGWYHGHPLEHAVVAEGRALQLLTHPIWWTGSSAAGPVGRLDEFVAQRQIQLQQELVANCEPYSDRKDQVSDD